MGFGHRIYRTTDPRAEALRRVAEGLAGDAAWLRLAIDVEDVALRLLAEHKPDRVLKTNVEYYASVVLDGVGLPSDLYTPAFAVARTAGWCAHVLEQAEHGRLIRPDAAYVGPRCGRCPPEIQRPRRMASRAGVRDPQHVRASRSARPRSGRASGGETEPTAAAAIASHRIGATAGSASRFAGTASGVRRPKCHHAIGAVTTVQAIEIAAASPTALRRRGATRMDRRDRRERELESGVEELERIEPEHHGRAARQQVPRRRRARREPCRRDEDSRNPGAHDRRAGARHEHVGRRHRPGRQPGRHADRRRQTPSATSVNAIRSATFWPLTATTW